MERPPLELGDLVEHWTLVGKEPGLVSAKNYESRLGFALLLKFYGRFGRFPRGRGELHDDAVEFVARQLGVSAGSMGFYEWSGRTVKRHRAEIRAHFGFRECTVADADELAGWLADGYAQEERRYELVRDALLAEFRSRSIEPPTPDRVERIVRSGMRTAEKILTARISARLPDEVRARLLAQVSAEATGAFCDQHGGALAADVDGAAAAAAVADWKHTTAAAARVQAGALHLHHSVVRDALATRLDWWDVDELLAMHPQAAFEEYVNLAEGTITPPGSGLRSR